MEFYQKNIDKSYESIGVLHELPGLKETIIITKLKLNEDQNKLNLLWPRYKNKRGLINGLGSVIKFITGNMDANDAQSLNDIIEKNKFTEQI